MLDGRTELTAAKALEQFILIKRDDTTETKNNNRRCFRGITV